jgi:uncharacterized membrane-anchored protein
MDTRPSKVPEITLTFWIMNIAANTLGETAGDAVTMTLDLGYTAGMAIFAILFLAMVTAQIRTKTFHPALYWLAVVATTTVGTTIADFADRSLGLGYVGGSATLFALIIACLGAWWLICGSISVSRIILPREETFYWAAIFLSNTLGTAQGDVLADDAGLGYRGAALALAAALAVIAALHRFTRISSNLLFWAAFIVTCPLGASLGDLLTKPAQEGGLNFDRILSSLAIAGFSAACVHLLPARAWQPSARGRDHGGAAWVRLLGRRAAISTSLATPQDQATRRTAQA